MYNSFPTTTFSYVYFMTSSMNLSMTSHMGPHDVIHELSACHEWPFPGRHMFFLPWRHICKNKCDAVTYGFSMTSYINLLLTHNMKLPWRYICGSLYDIFMFPWRHTYLTPSHDVTSEAFYDVTYASTIWKFSKTSLMDLQWRRIRVSLWRHIYASPHDVRPIQIYS